MTESAWPFTCREWNWFYDYGTCSVHASSQLFRSSGLPRNCERLAVLRRHASTEQLQITQSRKIWLLYADTENWGGFQSKNVWTFKVCLAGGGLSMKIWYFWNLWFVQGQVFLFHWQLRGKLLVTWMFLETCAGNMRIPCWERLEQSHWTFGTISGPIKWMPNLHQCDTFRAHILAVLIMWESIHSLLVSLSRPWATGTQVPPANRNWIKLDFSHTSKPTCTCTRQSESFIPGKRTGFSEVHIIIVNKNCEVCKTLENSRIWNVYSFWNIWLQYPWVLLVREWPQVVARRIGRGVQSHFRAFWGFFTCDSIPYLSRNGTKWNGSFPGLLVFNTIF